MTGTRDQLFDSVSKVEDFVFDDKVAKVFDDMIRRSVPFYDEVQRMVVEIAANFMSRDGVHYDIGCSTGTTIANLIRLVPDDIPIRCVGIEPSHAMVERARQKLEFAADYVDIIESDVQRFDGLKNAQVITMLYTLQFIRPIDRLDVLKKIRKALLPGGVFILAEKVLADTHFARRLYIDLYHKYKRRQGYSDTEISKKREALENVLIPCANEENMTLLRQAGFDEVEQAFRWYNFGLYIGAAAS